METTACFSDAWKKKNKIERRSPERETWSLTVLDLSECTFKGILGAAKPSSSTCIATTDYSRSSLTQALWEHITVLRKEKLCLCRGADANEYSFITAVIQFDFIFCWKWVFGIGQKKQTAQQRAQTGGQSRPAAGRPGGTSMLLHTKDTFSITAPPHNIWGP